MARSTSSCRSIARLEVSAGEFVDQGSESPANARSLDAQRCGDFLGLGRKAEPVCQQCHDDTSHRGYDYAQPEDGRGNAFLESPYIAGKQCLACHGEIHGSNHGAGGAYFE